MRVARLRIAVAIAGFLLAQCACNGPQRLSVAINPKDQHEYWRALEEFPASPRDAFYAIKARRTGRSVEGIARADAALSTARNPFDAYRDSRAVSQGAVIYEQHCLICHGETAEGRGPGMLVNLPKMNFRDFPHRFASTLHRGAPRAWFRKINDGYTSRIVDPDGSTNAMPPFKEVLAREQIWLAITYLQSLDAHATEQKEPPAE